MIYSNITVLFSIYHDTKIAVSPTPNMQYSYRGPSLMDARNRACAVSKVAINCYSAWLLFNLFLLHNLSL